MELTFLSGIELLAKGARVIATLAQLIRDQTLLDSVVSCMPTPLPSPAEGIFEPRRRTAEAWLRCYEKAKKVRAGLHNYGSYGPFLPDFCRSIKL